MRKALDPYPVRVGPSLDVITSNGNPLRYGRTYAAKITPKRKRRR